MVRYSKTASRGNGEAVEGEVVDSVPSVYRGGQTHRGTQAHTLRKIMFRSVAGILATVLFGFVLIVSVVILREYVLPGLLHFAVPVLAGAALFITLSPVLHGTLRQRLVPFLHMTSFLCGITAWLLGLLVTLQYWGVFAMVLGLVFLGVGVVPLGFLAAIFHSDWHAFLGIATMLVCMYGLRRVWRHMWASAQTTKRQRK